MLGHAAWVWASTGLAVVVILFKVEMPANLVELVDTWVYVCGATRMEYGITVCIQTHGKISDKNIGPWHPIAAHTQAHRLTLHSRVPASRTSWFTCTGQRQNRCRQGALVLDCDGKGCTYVRLLYAISTFQVRIGFWCCHCYPCEFHRDSKDHRKVQCQQRRLQSPGRVIATADWLSSYGTICADHISSWPQKIGIEGIASWVLVKCLPAVLCTSTVSWGRMCIEINILLCCQPMENSIAISQKDPAPNLQHL